MKKGIPLKRNRGGEVDGEKSRDVANIQGGTGPRGHKNLGKKGVNCGIDY